jgi:hypothetical protein
MRFRLAACCWCVIVLFGLNALNAEPPKASLDDLWKQAGDFQSKKLPKSELDVVDKILAQSRVNDDTGNILKAFRRKVELITETTDQPDSALIRMIQDEIAISRFPETPVLHTLLAKTYLNLCQKYCRQLFNRTEVGGQPPADPAAWSKQDYLRAIVAEENLALRDTERLRAVRMDSLSAILDTERDGLHALPTLFDQLTQSFFDLYSTNIARYLDRKGGFTFADSLGFAPAARFTMLEFTTGDSLASTWRASRLIQRLLACHLRDADPTLRNDLDLQRLRFVNDHCTLDHHEQVYERALDAFQSQAAGQPAYAEAAFARACLWNNWADQYDPLKSESHRWDRKKALELCRDAIEKVPDTPLSKEIRNFIDAILSPAFQIGTLPGVSPRKPFLMYTSLRNISRYAVDIYLAPDQCNPVWRQVVSEDDQPDSVLTLVHDAVFHREFIQPDPLDYQAHVLETPLEPLPSGNYVAVFRALGDFPGNVQLKPGIAFFDASQMAIVMDDFQSDLHVCVVDRESGTPCASASVEIHCCEVEWNDRKGARSIRITDTIIPAQLDKNGLLTITAENLGKPDYPARYYLVVRKGSESVRSETLHTLWYNRTEREQHFADRFYTDRAIYRPGQTVQFKLVALKGTNRNEVFDDVIVPNETRKVFFNDANGQTITTLELRTNEFGSASGSFSIPLGLLPGYFSLQSNYGSESFRVEEYKRPRFEVTLDPVADAFRVGDRITVTGTARALAGYPIDHARVKFVISRRVEYPWWRDWYNWHSNQSAQIRAGNVVSDAEGRFSISFDALPDPERIRSQTPLYIFSVTVDVTDGAGETQSGDISIRAGNTALVLTSDTPEKLDRRNARPIQILARNLMDRPQAANVAVTIERLQSPDRLIKPRVWKKPDRYMLSRDEFLARFPNDEYADETDYMTWKSAETTLTASMETARDSILALSGVTGWKTGFYRITLKSTDKFGSPVSRVDYFTLYDAQDDTPPYIAPSFFQPLAKSALPGKTVEILVGSSAPRSWVLCELRRMNRPAEIWMEKLGGKVRTIRIPVTEADRGGIVFHTVVLTGNSAYQNNCEIDVPWSNLNLKLTFSAFRSPVLPGSHEEWRIRVRDDQNRPVSAELVATLYDASLDAFARNDWQFLNPPEKHDNVRWKWPWRYISPLGSPSVSGWSGAWRYRSLIGLKWSNRYRGESKTMQYDGINIAMDVCTESNMSIDTISDASPRKSAESGARYAMTPKAAGGAADEVASAPTPRTNLAETAFFRPALRTDENGEAVIAFTMPEALTRWKFQALGYTKAMQFGFLNALAETRKPLMIVPNAPRFLREGDVIDLAAKVVNLDDSALAGNARLQLLDAITLSPVDSLFALDTKPHPFTVKKGESAVVVWRLRVPSGLGAVTWRFTAQCPNFSDGEENTLPILSNRMLVTDTLPMPLRGKQTRQFHFDRLTGSSSTARPWRLTLEYAANPAWYALSALPTLFERYPCESTDQVFRRYYANSIGANVVNSSPKFRAVFESWSREKAPDALTSNLEKNQELKAVVLQETPWVAEAQDETTRRHRVGSLFDTDRMTSETSSAFNQIRGLQRPSGAWAWFPGGDDSRWTTQYIVGGFGRLIGMGVLKRDNVPMVDAALSYMDSELAADYADLTKYDRTGEDSTEKPDFYALQYFYAHSQFKTTGVTPSEARGFYLRQFRKYWGDYSLMEQAMLGLIFHRLDDDRTANEILKSLDERAQNSPEMGMYWKSNTSGWCWWNRPIETQSLLIEFFDEVGRDREKVDEMRTWLIRQKQTNDWGNGSATADACFALLSRGTDWLDTKPAAITLGGKPVAPDRDVAPAEVGTGYFKVAWNGSDITPSMGEAQVSNPNAGPAWGTLYYQYFEDLDKITPADSPLKVSKQVYRMNHTGKGDVLEPITADTPLRVGDQLTVRLEIRTDRDMDYVCLKDARAAGLEPVDALSGYEWKGGLGYYRAVSDAATSFFFDRLRKGTYVFEYSLRAANPGQFSNGIATLQCCYAPEFSAHSGGIQIRIDNQ